MNQEQRKKVTRDQINKFFASYFPSWRLQQILMIEKLLNERFSFFPSIMADTKQPDDDTGEATIAQETVNGLLFDAVSNCVQYIEDLFALLKAGENKDYFIKNIITYDAGKIENFIRQSTNDEKICNLFHFPYFQEAFENKEVYNAYKESIARMSSWMNDFRKFHSEHLFFYKQYKHGLTVALRPYGPYDEEKIQKSKTGELDGYLAAFDNLNLSKVKDKKDRFKDYVFMPAFTENIRPHLSELMKEDNLVRYIFPPTETKLKKIKDIAFRVRRCHDIFRNNILWEISDESPFKMQMPAEIVSSSNEFIFKFLTETEYVDEDGKKVD